MSWREYAQGVGISSDECNRLEELLGRGPNLVEIEMVAAMWSEHCSYKSSRNLLKKLPITSKIDKERVLCGPGENAGAVSIGDGQMLVFKVESHNHPSYVDPEQGAATGVGGILRDIFTMGARPVALMNGLFFGDWSYSKTPCFARGVAKGIGSYGNCMGIPTIGGTTLFHSGYNKNILVNVMALGIAEKLFYSKGDGVGNLLIYAGNLTGTDGVHGAHMSSSPLDEEIGDDPIQVADPFMGKAMMESSLELLETGKVIALQDMGAAGITCSTTEIASKGNLGVEINLDLVPQRGGIDLTTKEILLSESQERMLFVMKPEDLPIAQQVFDKWDVYHSVIGKLTEDKLVRVRHYGEMVAEVPIKIFTDDAPCYEREQSRDLPHFPPAEVKLKDDLESLEDCMIKLLTSQNFCSKDWMYQQYDSTVGGNTIHSNSSNLSVLRVEVDKEGREDKAVAAYLNCPFTYCDADPEEGAAISVAECWRNLISTGAKPLAITNCLNFADPRDPKNMGKFALVIDGMAKACEALDFPVVSGNVSFYNQTGDVAIPPTPVIGGVGLVDSIPSLIPNHFQNCGNQLVIIGDTAGHLERSAYAEYVLEQGGGRPPNLDLELEKKIGEFVQTLNVDHVKSCSAIGVGGLMLTVFRSCIENAMGIELHLTQDLQPISLLFGEDQSRYLVETDNLDYLLSAAAEHSIPVLHVGNTIQEFKIKVESVDLNMEKLLRPYRNAMPKRLEP